MLPRQLCVSTVLFAGVALGAVSFFTSDARAAGPEVDPPFRVIFWNDLGMHCMDSDYSVFALLPPFNTINAQFILNGDLVRSPGAYTLWYEGTPDANGSINTSSAGKTNFWSHVPALFGVSLPVDMGLAGNAMPGAANTPQSMAFDATANWFHADGIPITPTDDGLAQNHYPMLRVSARNGANQEVSSTVNVVPISDEMDCSGCHSSASSPYAQPYTGWVFESDPERDFRLNILRLHDENRGGGAYYTDLLNSLGYNPNGLYETVTVDGNAILCAACHASNALPGTGIAGVPPLTQAIHGRHADVLDETGLELDSTLNRTSCYTCHPGSATKCLRGAMGKAVSLDGSLAMQCQSCHGTMSRVADSSRVGWLDPPACQNCHTGPATNNRGAIRFTSVFDAGGNPHLPADPIFATNPDTPAPGFDLYRFSAGHGGLQCSACHGSPHAIYPALYDGDNLQNIQIQGHEGTLVECASCHLQMPRTDDGGPHGMHTIGQEWVGRHGDVAEHGGLAGCRACHGADDRGTVLSYSQADRTLNTEFGTKHFWRGVRVSCYACHDGPRDDDRNNNRAPAVADRSATTPADVALPLTLAGSDQDGDALSFRIVSQPKFGTVALSGSNATYHPDGSHQGPDAFTYAAWDGETNSNLGTVTVHLTAAVCQGSAETYNFGCPDRFGYLPTLSLSGCPAPGETVVLELEHGQGGATALLLVGSQRAAESLGAGCVLRVAPVLEVLTQALSGSLPGEGGFQLPINIPASAVSGALTLQAFIRDTGPGRGLSGTNGLEVRVE